MKTTFDYIHDLIELSEASYGDEIKESNFLYSFWTESVNAYPLKSKYQEKYNFNSNLEDLETIQNFEERAYAKSFRDLIDLTHFTIFLWDALRKTYIHDEECRTCEIGILRSFENFNIKNKSLDNLFLIEHIENNRLHLSKNTSLSNNETKEIKKFLKDNYDFHLFYTPNKFGMMINFIKQWIKS